MRQHQRTNDLSLVVKHTYWFHRKHHRMTICDLQLSEYGQQSQLHSDHLQMPALELIDRSYLQ